MDSYDPRQPATPPGFNDLETLHAPFPFQRLRTAVQEATMNNRNLLKGVFLMLIALAFGGTALTYGVGSFSRSGPGLFPLLISGMLFVVGLASTVRAHFVESVPVDYSLKNIAIVLASLIGFALISEHLNMLLAIVFLVFCATLAGTSYSIARNIKITLGLIAVAFAFKHGLGLSLPLF